MHSNSSDGNVNAMLPRILILDDLFGRSLPNDQNIDRENLCAHFLWHDSSGDEAEIGNRQKVLQPTAEAVFFRAQTPRCADIGDIVKNDLKSTLEVIRGGWPPRIQDGTAKAITPWSMLLLDLCFYTGRVTEESHRRTPGMPEGMPGDDDPDNYFGLTLLDAIHREFPELPIFILSSKPRDDVSLEFSRRGALGFIARDDIRGPELLQEALWQHGLLCDSSGQIVGQSLPMLLALREARRAAGHRENVLIRGERGVGKELLAQYIHQCTNLHAVVQKTKPEGSERHDKKAERPFVTVNSAVFTPNLFASELFGIQPRTATGVDGKFGLIETADHGDLFLDEIADMSAEVQAAMLRVSQERRFTPVGARKPKSVDVRFLSATNVDLEDEALRFRADLLDRLRIGGTLWLPPLRERQSDIPLLTERYVREAEVQRKGAMRRQITAEVLDALRSYHWPGNVREFRSVIVDAVNRHPDVEHFVPGHLRFGAEKDRIVSVGSSPPQSMDSTGESVVEMKDFAQLMEVMTSFQFDPADREAWAGKFSQFQSVFARLAAKYIKVALLASRKPTPDNLQGNILIHPAIRLLTGDRKLTASKAADLIKRCLNISPIDRDEILKDEVLKEAYEIAMRLRPSSGRKKLKSPSREEPES